MKKGFFKKISKKFLLSICILLLVFAWVKVSKADNHPFAGGEGTFEDPYQIENCTQLQSIKDYLSNSFELINDIDCSLTNPNEQPLGYTGEWDDDLGFLPIGSEDAPFTGSLSGNNKSIENLYIKRSIAYIGLFGYIERDSEIPEDDILVIKDLNILNFEFIGEGNEIYMGGLAGYIYDYNIISDINAQGVLKGNNGQLDEYIGGLFGYLSAEEIRRIKVNDLTIYTSDGTRSYSGGLAGLLYNRSNLLDDIEIENIEINSSSEGQFLGGLTGMISGNASSMNNLKLNNIYIEGYDNIGGMAGQYVESGTISNLLIENVNIIGRNNLGGLAGLIANSLNATDSLQINNINITSSGSKSGGFSGEASGTITANLVTLNNIAITSSGSEIGGFAGQSSGNISINEIELNDINLQGNDKIGGFIGDYSSGGIINKTIINNLEIIGNNDIGGAFGNSNGRSGVIENISVQAILIKGQAYVGGISGTGSNNFSFNQFSGNIEANSNVGGIAGTNSGQTILNSFIDAKIIGSTCVGGLVGYGSGILLSNNAVFAQMIIDSDNSSYAGGILGCLSGDNIVNNYFVGTITNIGAEYSLLGGIVGGPDGWSGPFSGNNYWDSDVDPTINRSAQGGGDNDPKSWPKNSSEMKSLVTFEDWDIDLISDHDEEIWYINEGNDYPRLFWQEKEFTIDYFASEGGSISGEASQSIYRANSGRLVEAIANEGWEFTNWDDEYELAVRQEENVNTNKILTANFAIKQYQVNFKDSDGSLLKSEIINHGDNILAPSDPIKRGYNFLCWSRSLNNITASQDIIAQYERISNSAPLTIPSAIGKGEISFKSDMNEKTNIGELDDKGINYLSFVNSRGIFSIKGEAKIKYTLFIENVDLYNNKIVFQIEPSAKKYTLDLYDNIVLDLNNNLYDVYIEFVNIYVNRTELFIKLIKKEINPDNNEYTIEKDDVITREIEKQLTKNQELTEKLVGRLLLQVEEKGQSWYLEPVSKERHFMGRPTDAFDLMRKFGLGISESNYNKFVAEGVPSRFAGRIFLRVESHGEAYYINPLDMKMHFLGRPDDAFKLMRELSLGISNENIRQIPIAN